MRFSLGEIIHIPKYKFPDGTIKETGKFVIIFSISENKTILVSLTTSKIKYTLENSKGGCSQNSFTDAILGYHIKANKVICNNGFCFIKDTFIIPTNQLVEHTILELKNHTPKIERKGKIDKKIFIEMLECFINSEEMFTGFERILIEQLEKLTKKKYI